LSILFTLAVSDVGVVFHDGKKMVCRDRKTGTVKWEKKLLLDDVIPTSNTPTLVLYKDVILFVGGKDDSHRGGGWYAMRNLRTLSALSAESGEVLWQCKMPPTGFECPKDVMVLDDLVWVGAILLGPSPAQYGKLKNDDERDNSHTGKYTGRDIHTGGIVREFSPPWEIYWFHQRCHRSRATENYIIPGRTGIEFISPKEGWVSFNHWVRGACLYGVMPANGLIYQPQHPCGCYMESLLHGFNALSPVSSLPGQVEEKGRLVKGPAYDRPLARTAVAEGDWPTYRGDNERSARQTTGVPDDVRVLWTSKVGTGLSAPTVAGGKVFVAQPDSHSVHALSAESGEEIWSCTAGGRVDSPPTIHAGRVLFGCRDGYLYCLDSQVS